MLIIQAKHMIHYVLKYTTGWMLLAIIYDELVVHPIFGVFMILMCSWVSYEVDVKHWRAERLMDALTALGAMEGEPHVKGHIHTPRFLSAIILSFAGLYTMTHFMRMNLYGEAAFSWAYFVFVFWLSLDLGEYYETNEIYEKHRKIANQMALPGKLE